MKIVSGAQTGVDRAALDAALECGIEAGGWCPQGRRAEDGSIPQHYPVTELPGGGYLQRTEQNVIDSDGTLIIYYHTPSGGTSKTIDFCIKHDRRYLMIDALRSGIEDAASSILDFVTQHDISILNVAGPRASGEPRAYDYAKRVMLEFLNVANIVT